MKRISVCIATYRRPDRLHQVLVDMTQQSLTPDQVVVVDNDASASARPVVEQCRAMGTPFTLDYDVQPEPSIATTRNRTVQLASGDWLAFIDDDERAPKDWLQKLVNAADTFQADGVLAPVEPQVPDTAPTWIRRGRFYDFPHQADGAVMPLNRMRFGNVLLGAQRVRALPGPFDSTLGLAAGEDVDMLVRLAHSGARIVWYDQAPVFEPVEAHRLSLRWLLLRALSGGQGFARYTIKGGFGPINRLATCVFFIRAGGQLVMALCLTVIALPFGRHRAAAWLIKASANIGKLTILIGWRYEAYGRASSSG